MPHSVHSTPTESPTPTPQIIDQGILPINQRYWNANLCQSKWTEKCPDYLLGQGAKNIGILSGRQEDYRNLSWSECQRLVAVNRIGDFQRSPLALRRYLQYMFKLKQTYGSVLSFVQKERLHWNSVTPSGDALFAEPTDYKILFNDWPYGIDPDITHLVVWTKFLLDDDPETGFLTQECHNIIEDFVQRTFCNQDGVDRSDLIWFKNWKSLKSVHALEHFHIMIYKAPEDFLKLVTNGDRPMSEMVGDE